MVIGCILNLKDWYLQWSNMSIFDNIVHYNTNDTTTAGNQWKGTYTTNETMYRYKSHVENSVALPVSPHKKRNCQNIFIN